MKTINKNTCHYPAGLDNPEKGNSHFTRYSGQARVGQTKKAFTLVELIIVITILAILATIAFISFQGFTKNARDGNRVSTIKNIESGLELYMIKTGNYPQPEGEISTGTINDQALSYKGVIGDTIGKQINMNKTPLDPLTEKNYVYGITQNKKEYQIASILEGDTAYQNLIPTTYASSYYSKVSGNYKGFIIYSSGITNEQWIANIPSLIYNFTGTTNLLSTTGAYFIIHKGMNLPYAPNPQTQINHKALEATIQEKTKNPDAKIINISKNALTQFLSGGTLPDGITNSGQLFSSFGVETKESLEVLITGTSSQVVPPPTPPVEDQTPPETPTTYTVTFNSNLGTAVTQQTITANSQATTPTPPTKTGNTFAGWYSDVGLTTTYNFSTQVTGNITLYAKWTFPPELQLCTANGQIIYTDASGNEIGQVNTDGTEKSGNPGNLITTGHIVVCNGPQTGYVLKSINEGATAVGATNTIAAYGNVYQWGRNKAFSGASLAGAIAQNSTQITSYDSNTDTDNFVWNSSLPSPYTWADGDITENWGVSEANKTTATWANSTDPNKAKMKGPCPTDYHVPTNKEWNDVIAAGSWCVNGCGGLDDLGTSLSNALKLPFAGYRNRNYGSMDRQGSYGYYWSSSPRSTYADRLYFYSSYVDPSYLNYRANGLSVRCFKN